MKSLEEIEAIDFNIAEIKASFDKIEEENKLMLKGCKRVSGYELINYLNDTGFLKNN